MDVASLLVGILWGGLFLPMLIKGIWDLYSWIREREEAMAWEDAWRNR